MAKNEEKKATAKTKINLPLIIKLEYPINWGQDSGQIITEIVVKRRFTMGDFRDMTERDLEQTDAAVTLISKITSEAEALIWALDPCDFEKVTKEIEPFFPKSQRIGARGLE